MEGKQSRRAQQCLMVLLGAAAAAAALWLWESGLLERMNSREEIRAMIEAAGPFAGAVYFLIQLLTVIIAPIPSNISMMAGALAMGFWAALLLGLAAIWLGSMGVFLLARRLGQRRVQMLVDRGAMEKYLPVIREKRPLVVLISQGGTSTNILRAIEQLAGKRLLALTGRETCRVNEMCANHVLLACGPEDVGPKTKGYTTTILTLYLMAMEAALATGRLGQEAYDAMAAALANCFERMPECVQKAETMVEDNAGWLMQTGHFAIVGKGQAGLVARECVIRLVETMLTPAMAYDFEEFLHGPVSLIDEQLGGIYLLPPEGDADRARMLAVAGYHQAHSGRVLLVEPEACGAGTPWYTHVFTHVLPCQLMAALLPERMGVGKRGEEVFYEVDALVDIKYGHVV